MNWITIAVGTLAAAYGGYTIWARRKKPEQFGKLAAMKERWGEKPGTAMHVISYTVLPIVLGLILVIRGVLGGSIY